MLPSALLTNQPVWLVQVSNDPTVSSLRTDANYNLMKPAGADVYYTIFPNVIGETGTEYNEHWSWVYTYNNFVEPGVEHRGPTSIS